jgi:hypothetical protein
VRFNPPGIQWQLDVASRRDRAKTLAASELIRMIDEEVHDLVRRGIWQGSPDLY